MRAVTESHISMACECTACVCARVQNWHEVALALAAACYLTPGPVVLCISSWHQMCFGCDREEKEVLYSIIYFHESSFELSGLPVGPASASRARELP